MIRILQVVNDMHRAGLETMLMNYYRNIDRTQIQFDFLTHRPYKSDYDDEIISMGGKMYYAPRLYPQNYPQYFKYMKRFFAEHSEYNIIHSHIDSMSYLPLKAAKISNVPIRIAHSHNTSIDKDMKSLLKMYFKSRINNVTNQFCACGEQAGQFLFGHTNYTVIPNAIEVEKFLFKNEIREKKRKELGADDNFIIGHVGRFSHQKNHKFLIEIFNEIYKKEKKAKLILIGVGEKESEILSQVKALSLEESVILLGNRNDVNELYQAMDAYVMPSFYEGIPVVGVEAQFSGLPCIFSDKVPKEVQFTSHCKFISLNNNSKKWADTILEYKNSIEIRDFHVDDLSNSHYDIKNSHKLLEDYYLGLLKKK